MDLGIDLEDTQRFQLSAQDPFILRHFTEAEIDYSYGQTQPEIHLAAFFCVKEAISKVIGPQEFLDWEVLHEDSGKPFLKLNGTDVRDHYKISISHTDTSAVAVVLKV